MLADRKATIFALEMALSGYTDRDYSSEDGERFLTMLEALDYTVVPKLPTDGN